LKMAEFKIGGIFRITDRGEVLKGEIIEGEISAGNIIRILTDGESLSLKIQSVEFIDYIELKKSEVALMLGIIDKNVRAKIELMVGQIIPIEKTGV
jgi:hypothetical protein